MATVTIPSGFSRDMEIFEYTGINEEEPNYDDDHKSQVVEVLESSVKSSFGKFKEKQISSNTTDFSDNVSKHKQYGFQVDPDDFESGVPPTQESLMQRYTRLKQEVTQLLTDVDQLKDSDKELGSVSPADIVLDVQQLQKQLSQMELDRTLTNSKLTGTDEATHSLIFKNLQAELAAIKSQPEDQSTGHIYEVYANLESAKFGHLSKLSEIEGRISVLENLVGNSDSKGSIVAAGLDAEYKDLSGTVLSLQAKVSLLDSSHLASITGQLKVLLDNLKQVETNVKESNTDQKAKISDALQLVSQVTPLITVVPELVDRLHTLKELHEHAAQLVSVVATISKGQETLKEQIASCKSLLEQVQRTVEGNVEKLQANFNNLEKRMK